MEGAATPRRKPLEARPLTTDERASFVILSLYMLTFCFGSFMYSELLLLQIIGLTAGAAGLFLFVAAFFNTESPEKGYSIHPLRSYLVSIFITLAVLLSIRLVVGMIESTRLALIITYGGLLTALIVFRKAMVQVVSVLLILVFLGVSISNRNAVMDGTVKFHDAVRQSGKVLLRIGPIQDVANLFLTGNYIGYLSHIDYRNEQINILATRTVVDAEDDEIRKTQAILGFVSNHIHYVSDPGDGLEYIKDPITTLIAGGGDCEDQTLLLCSMLESVGVTTYIAFTDEHVFALVRFNQKDPQLTAAPFLFVEGWPCYALDAADPGATIGRCAAVPRDVTRVFDVRKKSPAEFSLALE